MPKQHVSYECCTCGSLMDFAIKELNNYLCPSCETHTKMKPYYSNLSKLEKRIDELERKMEELSDEEEVILQ